jgi:hypothetical protein
MVQGVAVYFQSKEGLQTRRKPGHGEVLLN